MTAHYSPSPVNNLYLAHFSPKEDPEFGHTQLARLPGQVDVLDLPPQTKQN